MPTLCFGENPVRGLKDPGFPGVNTGPLDPESFFQGFFKSRKAHQGIPPAYGRILRIGFRIGPEHRIGHEMHETKSWLHIFHMPAKGPSHENGSKDPSLSIILRPSPAKSAALGSGLTCLLSWQTFVGPKVGSLRVSKRKPTIILCPSDLSDTRRLCLHGDPIS